MIPIVKHQSVNPILRKKGPNVKKNLNSLFPHAGFEKMLSSSGITDFQ